MSQQENRVLKFCYFRFLMVKKFDLAAVRSVSSSLFLDVNFLMAESDDNL